MPISMAAGTIRTPEFVVKNKYYNIEIDVKWLLPTVELRCRMGFGLDPLDDDCKWDSLLEIKWTVVDENQIIANGYVKGRSAAFEADSQTFSRWIGRFKGQAHHRYIVELTFVKDASLLNVTQPHLIVEPPDFSF